MSFPVFLIGPILQVIAGVVRYAIDASKTSPDSPAPSSQGQGPTVEFSPLLAELAGSQAYAGNLLPQGWLVPSGDSGAAVSSASAPLAENAPPLLQEAGFQSFPLQGVMVRDISPSVVAGSPPAEAAGSTPLVASVLTSEPAPFELNSPLPNNTPMGKAVEVGAAPNASEAGQAGLGEISEHQDLTSSVLPGVFARPATETTKEGQALRVPKHLPRPLLSDVSVPDPQAIEGGSAMEGEGSGIPFAYTRLDDDRFIFDGLPKKFVSSPLDQPVQSPDALLLPAVPEPFHGMQEASPVKGVATVAPREPANVTGQLIHAVRVNWENGRTEARLHLEPPDLGAVRIQMVMDHSALSLKFHAGSEATRSLLEASLHELRDQLSQQGISVGQMSVGVALDLAGRSGGQLPAPFRVRDERWKPPSSARVPELHTVAAPAISLSAIDLFA
jgi:hypothetical protein